MNAPIPTASRLARSELRSFLIALACAALIAGGAHSPAVAQSDARLAQVQQHLDRGEATQALALLKTIMKRGKPSAEALLLRSTAHIMAGNAEDGFRDLKRALKIDPGLRQGWLNLAGLEIAEGNFDEAYDALLEARKLDPSAADNHLNLGAVLVMQHQLGKAREHFSAYLEQERDSADAYYLVASNFALAGEEDLAVEYLDKAIELDEHIRLTARSDDRFVALGGPEYRRLLNIDSYVPPPGAHTVSAAFEVPYRRTDPKLIYAVLDALKENGEIYNPNIEATDHWALIWGDMRIKLFTQTNGTGVVSLSAPADRISPDEWHRRSQALFRAIHVHLERASRGMLGLPPR